MNIKLFRETWPKDSDFVNGVAKRIDLIVTEEMREKIRRKHDRGSFLLRQEVRKEWGQLDLGDIDGKAKE